MLCAAIAGALRAYLGDDSPRLRAVMPTNLRRLDRPVSHWLGNEFGLVLPTIPTDEPDPGRRMERVHRVDVVDQADQPGAGDLHRHRRGGPRPRRLDPGPRAPLRRGREPDHHERPRPASGSSRSPGRACATCCSGCRAPAQLALGVSILSYAGRVRLGIARRRRRAGRRGGRRPFPGRARRGALSTPGLGRGRPRRPTRCPGRPRPPGAGGRAGRPAPRGQRGEDVLLGLAQAALEVAQPRAARRR